MIQLWVNVTGFEVGKLKNPLKIGVASHTVGVAEDKVGEAVAPPTV